MNRRIFLQRSSFAAIAISGLPMAIRASGKKEKQEEAPRTYASAANNNSNETVYGLSIFHSAVTNFNAATDEQKIITLGAKYYETSERTAPARSGEFQFIIRKVKKLEEDGDVYEILAKSDRKISGDFELPKELEKTCKLRFKAFTYVNIVGKDGNLAALSYVAPGSNSDSCFLTTACVQHQQLSDQCVELQTLRELRDHYMRSNRAGKKLISQYQIAGPAIVKAINGCENKKEIYAYMYQHMILPSVDLTKKRNYKNAVAYYAVFVEALQNKYC